MKPRVLQEVCDTSECPVLLGRYTPPDVEKGDRVYCRYRKAWCRVTGWGTGPIAWPRIQEIGVRGRPGLLVNATLERAIRTESAAALIHWFGQSPKPVSWWRRAFRVGGHVNTRGSRQLHRQRACNGGRQRSRNLQLTSNYSSGEGS
ncbi:MAG: hypothetical protein U0792_12715 [Gemmataceae bacterium]